MQPAYQVESVMTISNRSSHWSPILDGGLAARANDAIAAIADSLVGSPPRLESGSLAGGHAGLALFYDYLARAGIAANADELAELHLGAAIDAVATERMRPALYGGFTGVAWSASHIQGHMFDETTDDPNE